MEEEVPRRRSVSELAGKFKESSPAAANEAEKPVRRRPPRTLQLPKAQGDHQESGPGVTSPLPSKAKRNSALIEKLQANLALSPAAPPKSPGFRLLPPAFGPPSPAAPAPTSTLSATPTSPIAASPVTEEEGPASFEAPPTAAEGCLLLSVNKGRARHSIRRRPPSRRHRKSSCGDEVNDTDDATDTQPSSQRGERGDGEEQRQPDALTSLHRNKSIEDETKNSDGRTEGERQEGGASSEPEAKEEEKEKKEKEEESSEQIQKHEEGGIGGTEKEKNEEALDSTR